MIKTLQKRFVITAMTAVTILLSVLLGGINIVNYVIADRGTDDILRELVESQGSYRPPKLPAAQGRPRESPLFQKPSPDAVMGARFFLAFFDASGTITSTDTRHIYVVSEEETRAIAEHILQDCPESGRYEQFKYQVSAATDGTGGFAVFLDVSRQQASILTVLLASCGIGSLCWLTMLLLMVLLSRRAIQPIARNIEKQRQFVTNAGHEIKTPLAIILANTDAMELHNGENKWSRNIRAQTVRLNGLMQNLLTLAKMDEGGGTLPMSDFSMELLLEETLDLYREPAAAKDITLQTQIQPGATLRANRDGIMQLLSILLDNAIKYTPSGGRVWVSLEKAGQSILLRVKNTCGALPEGDLEKLFERFYRGDAARTQSGGGYGIGLSAARAIAEAHGGAVSAARNPETTSMVFTVIL